MNQSARARLLELVHERLSLFEVVAADNEALERYVARRAPHVFNVGAIALRVLMHDSATTDRDARCFNLERHATERRRL